MLKPAPGRRPRRPGRRTAALAVAAAVLSLHGLLLGWLPQAPGPGWRGDGPRPLQVRQIAPPPAAAAATPGHAEPAAATPATPRARALPSSPPAAAHAAGAQAAAEPAPAAAAAVPSEAPQHEPGGESVPVYTTRLPTAATLQYALRRGRLSGQAELRWRPEGPRYEITLRGQAAGVPLLGSTSRGELDSHGIAPERQTESRRGRELRAVNFQRDRARITFSGPALEYPLPPGAQDRLSWMLQLAGVMAADATRAEPGREVRLFVAGPRGDAAVWLFTVVGRGAVELPAGTVPDAVHLRREPRRPYDTAVDVWLDPARQHLPVQLRLLLRPTGESTEFLLEAGAAP